MYMLNIYVCQTPDRCVARTRPVGKARLPLRGLGYGLLFPSGPGRPMTHKEVRPFHHAERRAVPTPSTCIRRFAAARSRGADRPAHDALRVRRLTGRRGWLEPS